MVTFHRGISSVPCRRCPVAMDPMLSVTIPTPTTRSRQALSFALGSGRPKSLSSTDHNVSFQIQNINFKDKSICRIWSRILVDNSLRARGGDDRHLLHLSPCGRCQPTHPCAARRLGTYPTHRHDRSRQSRQGVVDWGKDGARPIQGSEFRAGDRGAEACEGTKNPGGGPCHLN